MDLSQIKAGESAQISGFQHCTVPQRRKLLAIGLTRGTTVNVKRLAPMGDPMELHLRGFALCLRKSEAQWLLVERQIDD